VSHADAEAEGTLGFERIVFFSDAVFAIVITLLVLPLTAEIELPDDGTGLAAAVWSMRTAVLSFAVSFLVVGQFWIAHHRTFGSIRRFDGGLVWLNLLLLLTVAFMPFPAALLSRRTDDDSFPVVFYAVSMTLASALLSAIWVYAVQRGLLSPSVAQARVRQVSLRAAVPPAVFAASIGVAFLGLGPAAVMWLVVLPAARSLVARRPPGGERPAARL